MKPDGIDALAQNMDRQFEQVREQFKQVDQQFVEVRQQFERVDRRFEQVDQRFEQMDQRFEKLDQRVGHIEQILPTLATRAELNERLREEHETTRRHVDVGFEHIGAKIDLLVEGFAANATRLEQERDERCAADARLDVRVTHLEAARRPRR